ncbi:CATRA conflict system CASPASE/TPR repeat-associated protein [Actinoplanes sp. NPDC051513]|uniref:CATRA conflict system CASPASE/TPR repeat-associated protein n=1 Tax=Actinoplanes sp. NPDC051513 TaxID=3363908 RepID=UPI0037B6AB75
MPRNLAEQEFVAHLFAPLDGPLAGAASAQILAVWQGCRAQLGMTRPIPGAGLADELPADWTDLPEGPAAGLEDPSTGFQVVVRREHDVLNLSAALLAPRRAGIVNAVAPGWYEFTRWWDHITVSGNTALLGETLVYLAKAGSPLGNDVHDALPSRHDDGEQWWTRAVMLDGFAYWEVTPRGPGRSRRMVLLARPDEDERLGRLVWSAGDATLPRLGRHLLHASKVRYHARVHDGGQEPARIRDRLGGRLDRLTALLADPAQADEAATVRDGLAADEAALHAVLESLERMSRGVEIARDNMTRALPERALPDAELAGNLLLRIGDDIAFLESVRKRAQRTRDLVAAVRPAPAPRSVEHRICFGVDVVGYSGRSTPGQREVQRRVAALLEQVLRAIGLEVRETDRQPAGDGVTVVLPPGAEAHLVLPGLLHGWRGLLAADNATHPGDRIRLRISAGSGSYTVAELGFAGRSIIEVGRLLDCAELRAAVAARPDADVVALVSDRLHADVVEEGYPGLALGQFERVPVAVKEYRGQAWLWTGAENPVSRPPAGAGPPDPAP